MIIDFFNNVLTFLEFQNIRKIESIVIYEVGWKQFSLQYSRKLEEVCNGTQ